RHGGTGITRQSEGMLLQATLGCRCLSAGELELLPTQQKVLDLHFLFFMKSFGLGLIVGLLLSAPLVSILYLLYATTGTPFVPFDLFDGLVRILPGGFITFGIDTMVRLLMFLGVNLSDSSKTAEQLQAIAIFLSLSALSAGIFFVALKARSSH